VTIGIVTPGEKTSAKVWLKQKEQVFEFPLDKKPLMVRFDEGNHLLKEWTFEKSLDELLYQLQNDDVIGRDWAASGLYRFVDNPRTIKGLTDRANHDEFWAVRRSAVETLGKLKRKEDIELFKDKCTDQNSKVRVSAMKILGDYEDPGLVSFFKEQFEKDDSYLAQAEALRSIGKCGDKSQIVFLENAAKMKSPGNVIAGAADWAIKKIGDVP